MSLSTGRFIIESGVTSMLSFSRPLSNSIHNTVEIGNFETDNGMHSLFISARVDTTTFVVAKHYEILIQYNQTNNVWYKLIPLDETTSENNNFDIDLKSHDSKIYLRIRRTIGSTPGTVYMFIVNTGDEASGTDVSTFIATHGVGIDVAPFFTIGSSSHSGTVDHNDLLNRGVHTHEEIDEHIDREEAREHYISATSLLAHKMVTLNSDNKLIYADKDTLAHANRVIGMTLEAVDADHPCRIEFLHGEVTELSWNFDTTLPVYLGNNGATTQVIPTTGFIQIIGFPGETNILCLIHNPAIILEAPEVIPAPTAEFSVVVSPRNSNAGTVNLTFSHSVTGVDITDFSLTRNGGDVPLSAPLLGGSGESYTLNLGAITTTDGSYILTLTAAGSGIVDSLSQGLVGNATRNWLKDAVAPTASFSVVTTPRNNSVGAVGLTFSKSVTGVDIADFSLTRNGFLVSLLAPMLTGANSNYSLDLSSVTSTDGIYVLNLVASGSGIVDIVGNPLVSGASRNWTKETVNPVASFSSVTSPRNSNAGIIHLSFSKNVVGVNIADFSLTRGLSPLVLTAPMLTGSDADYYLDLSTISTGDGSYILTLSADGSEILDTIGNPLLLDATRSWVKDSVSPTAEFSSISSPRAEPVGVVDITFSRSVTGVDIGDFSLTMDSSPVTLTAPMLTGSGTSYHLDLSSVTTENGDYELTLTAAGSSIVDSLSNPLVVDVTSDWTMYVVPPVTFPGTIWTSITKLPGAITAICETSDGHILLGTNEPKVYQTSDLITFTPVLTPNSAVKQIRKMVSGKIFSVSDSVYASTNNGTSWSSAIGSFAGNNMKTIYEKTPGTIYAFGAYGNGTVPIFKSIDDGATWNWIGQYSEGLNVITVSAGPTNGSNFLVTTSVSQGGTSIISTTGDSNPAIVFHLAGDAADIREFTTLSDSHILISFNNTIYKGSADGTTWASFKTIPDVDPYYTSTIGSLYSESFESSSAVLTSARSAQATSLVYRSLDGFETRTPSVSIIDGGVSYCMIRLSTGRFLLGTNGATYNLWTSVA